EDACADKQRLAVREPRNNRSDGEHGQPEEKGAPPAEDVADSPAGEQQPGEGEDVAVDDPLERRLPDSEIAADRRQRDVDNRVVDRGHEDGQRDGHQDPRFPVRVDRLHDSSFVYDVYLVVYGVDLGRIRYRRAVAGHRRTGQKAGLSREKVLSAALAIADAQGLDAVGVRSVASALDVTPMAIYRHVETRDGIVDGIGEQVLAEFELPPRTGKWREDIRALARAFRRTLLAHPAAVTVLLRRPPFTPAAMQTADAVLSILASAGFPPERAVLLYGQIARFLLALVLLEAESWPVLS